MHQFGAKQDLDNGYYDPHRYEYYSVVVSPYLKVSENTGVGMSGGFGGQRDDSSPTFRFGGNASIEATFGIYGRWLMKVQRQHDVEPPPRQRRVFKATAAESCCCGVS